MAKQTINLGTGTNAGDGDTIRDGGTKINDNFTELYDALGITAGDMGTFTGTTLTDNTSAAALFQELETALEALSPTVQGQFAGASGTFAGLPTVVNSTTEAVDNGDWALLTAVDGGNNPGLYVYNGTAWVFGSSLDFTSFSAFTGADGTNAGTEGLVPAPAAADNLKFLRGDGTWEEVQTDTLIEDWAATTDYVADQVVRQGALVLRAKGNHTSAATYTAAEGSNWEVIAQSVPTVWAASLVITEGELVQHLNSLYTCTVTFQTAADFSLGNLTSVLDGAELKEWTGDTRYELGTVVLYNGMLLRRTAEVPGGGVSESAFDDTEANRWAVIAQAAPYDDWAVSTLYIPGQRVRVDGTTYSRNTGQGGTSGADFASEAVNWTSEGVSTLDALQDVDTTTVAPSTGNFLVYDGTNWVPSSASVVATLLDSSGAVLDTPLPAATGNGAVIFLANDDVQANASTISVPAGESLNGVTDGVFITSNYPDGTQFIATDIGVGEWTVAVQGAATSREMLLYSIRGISSFDMATQTTGGITVIDLDNMVPSTANDGGQLLVEEIDDLSIRTGSTITIPADRGGRYRMGFSLNHDDTSFGGTSVQSTTNTNSAGLRINGTTIKWLSFDDATGVPDLFDRGPYTIIEFNGGDTIELVFNSDGAGGFEEWITFFSLEQISGAEVVLAGMVDVQPLYSASFTLSADATGIVCPFDLGQGDTSQIVNSAGTITLPAGKYRIVAHATRSGAVADYELFDATNNVVLEKFTNTGTGATDAQGSTSPYYLTVSAPTDIQVREGDGGTAITWNGRQSGVDAGFDDVMPNYGCYLDIQQIPVGQVVNPGDVPVEDVEVLLDEQTLSSTGTLTLPADLSPYEYIRFEGRGFGASNAAVSESIKVSEIANSRVAMHHDDGTGYVFFDINGTGTTATLTAGGTVAGPAVCRAIGIKAQKTVINTTDAEVTDWTSYGPLTIGGSTTAPTKGAVDHELAHYKVVGKSLKIRYNFRHTTAGAGGAGAYLFPIPAGFTIDVSQLITGDTGSNMPSVVGTAAAHLDGIERNPGTVQAWDANNLYLLIADGENTMIEVGSTWFALNSANNGFSFECEVPIV